jgi:hypothetical protein
MITGLYTFAKGWVGGICDHQLGRGINLLAPSGSLLVDEELL